MWRCLACGEELDNQFDTCWKCGTPRSETVPPADSIPKGDDRPTPAGPDPGALPPHALPEITYYSIPIWIFSGIAIAAWEIGSRGTAPDTPRLPNVLWSPLSIAHAVSGAILIHLPLAWLLLRAYFRLLEWWDWQDYLALDFLGSRWLLSCFRLPTSISERHPWFWFPYYGSLLSMCLAPFAFMGWILALAVSHH
jgi:hypothetical protein